MSQSRTAPLQLICTAIAGLVLLDAVVVGAAYLTLVAVPFVVAAIALRRGRAFALALLTIWCLVYVAISVNFALGTGFDAGWADLAAVYGGGVLALIAASLAIREIFSRRSAAAA